MRQFFAPIILRFKDTDALLATMKLFERLDRANLESTLRKQVDRVHMQVARELVRRNVRFW